MSARHRAEPQYDSALAPGVNNVAPELLLVGITDGIDGFECPHCGMYDPSIQQTVRVTAFRDVSPNGGGYSFAAATSFDPVEPIEYRCNHCLGEVRIVTGHAESLPII